MRLIDANELEKVMTEDWFLDILLTQTGKSDMAKKLVDLIDSVPLAYNVEKVVEGLEEIKGQGCVGVKCKDCKYTHNCFEGERAENVVIDKAIEIIRRGGVE